MEEQILLGDKLVIWHNFCKLVERINVSAIDPCGQICCRHVNNIICMVVATYILGLSFPKIKDKWEVMMKTLQRNKKGGPKNFSTYPYLSCNAIYNNIMPYYCISIEYCKIL